MQKSEEAFPEVYNTWDLERLYADLTKAGGKALSPNAKTFLRGILCGYSPGEIGKKLNYQGKDPSSTVRQTLSKEVYPVVEALLSLDQKIDWRKTQAPRLLECYRKGKNFSPSVEIPWKQVCQSVLASQRKMLLTSYPLGAARQVQDVYVPLELVERQSKPRLTQEMPPEGFSVREQEEKTTPISHKEFFNSVLNGQSPKSKGKRIAIIGEPGAGKTTLLQEISTKVDGICIWIDLASLERGKTLEEYLLHNWLKSSLSEIRKYAPEAAPNLLEPLVELKQAFAELFEQDQVWLLLDGADEMSGELGQPLNWIAQQLRQPNWVAKAKVVLTSRLNLWSTDGDRLIEFDTYRNLDFEPEQVIEFIDKWFADKPHDRDKLKEDWEKSSDRIKSLIRNPLRLTLLCITWKGVGDKFPETKAGLYQRLVRSHYEHQWKLRPESFAQFSDEEEQDKLSHWLGELSKTALDGKDPHFQGSRFRFRKSALTYFAKQSEYGSYFLKWALKLEWLHQIGLPSTDEVDADEPIYAFLHPTFQEYFAALALDDWHYFLNHIPEDPNNSNAIYRIFESQWREVIILWFGRHDITKSSKQQAFLELLDFQDACAGFYSFKAYFLAAECSQEFQRQPERESEEIISRAIKYAFGYSNEQKQWHIFLKPILQEARRIVKSSLETEIVKKYLLKLIDTCSDSRIRWDIANLLDEIGVKSKGIESIWEAGVHATLKPHMKEALGKLIAQINVDENYSLSFSEDELIEAQKYTDSHNNEIDNLIQQVQTSEDWMVVIESAEALRGATQNSQLSKIVKEMKPYFSNIQEYSSNELEKKHFRYEYIYEIIWHCAQNISYQDFYQIWCKPVDK